MRLMIFSDLDGTLLDHHDYSFDAARPALDALRDLGVPLILASSKTAGELGPLRRAMGLEALPAIVENGAGLLDPGTGGGGGGGAEYGKIRTALATLPSDLRRLFRGFADMDAAEIARITGLPPEAADQAARRAFSEPGLFSGGAAELDAFLAALAAHGITARRGGRFLTLSFGQTKAARMADLAAHMRPDATAALGDAPNDIEMIEAATHGVIIRNDHGPGIPPLPGEATGRIRRTQRLGPDGWNIAVLDLLSELGLKGGD